MKKRRLLSIVLSLCMVLALMPQMVFADDNSGTLEITIDGFQVGNTPNDCTYTVESTIPGITFNEDDIIRVSWLKDLGGGYNTPPHVFEADCNYRCGITLQPKSLEAAPNVTVNGITPRECDIVTQNGVPYALGIDCYLGTPAPVYTITYDSGEGEGSIVPGTKTHGKAFTLSSNTFTREGYIQTGWVDKEGKRYDLGGTYTQDASMTFYPVWDEILTLSAPFTTIVELGGNVAPGKTTFNLEVVDSEGKELPLNDYNVDIAASVETDGAGDYNGNLTFTGTASAILGMFDNEHDEYGYIYVKQADINDSNWYVDKAVWGLSHRGVAELSDEEVEPSPIYIFPAINDGTSYSVEYGENGVDKMTFVNKYVSSAVDPSDSEGTTGGDSDGNADKNAKTGDNANLTLWLALMLLSVAGIAGIAVYTRRKRTNE